MVSHQVLDRFFEQKRKYWQRMARSVYADIFKGYSRKSPRRKGVINRAPAVRYRGMVHDLDRS